MQNAGSTGQIITLLFYLTPTSLLLLGHNVIGAPSRSTLKRSWWNRVLGRNRDADAQRTLRFQWNPGVTRLIRCVYGKLVWLARLGQSFPSTVLESYQPAMFRYVPPLPPLDQMICSLEGLCRASEGIQPYESCMLK